MGGILGESNPQLCINRMHILYANTIQGEHNLFQIPWILMGLYRFWNKENLGDVD